MKKIIFLLAIITLTIGSCQKQDVKIAKPSIIDLGTHSKSMSYATIPLLNNGVLTINVNVTPGSKYSFQLTDIGGNEIVSKGLVADAMTETVTLDVSKVPAGFYDVNVLNVNGEEIKSPILIH